MAQLENKGNTEHSRVRTLRFPDANNKNVRENDFQKYFEHRCTFKKYEPDHNIILIRRGEKRRSSQAQNIARDERKAPPDRIQVVDVWPCHKVHKELKRPQ